MFLFQTKSDKEIQELDNYLISISIRMLRSLSDSSAMLSPGDHIMLSPGDHTADAPPAGVSACSSIMAVGATYQICKSKDDKDNMLLCDWCDKGYSTYCVVPSIENVPGSVPSILTTKRWEEEEELLPQPKAGYVEEKQVE